MNRSILVCLCAFTMNARGAPGDLESGFNPNADDEVWTVALQGDGKIIVGGWFDNIGGASRTGFGRLNMNGTADAGFPGPVFLDSTELSASCAVLSDGSVLSGRDARVENNTRFNFAKFTPNGVVDQTFLAPNVGNVRCMLIQDDGKILIGGSFRNIQGTTGQNNYLMRLNAGGSIDTTFVPNVNGTNTAVLSMAWQSDGRFLIAGDNIASVGGVARSLVVRLNGNGTLDSSFNPTIAGSDPSVQCVAVQPDGKIIIGGNFDTVNGQARPDVVRLNPNGTADTQFLSGQVGGVRTCAVLTDGRIAIGGAFQTVGGQPRHGFAMLNADGSLDTAFSGAVTGTTNGLAVQADGKILRAGSSGFGSGSTTRKGVARVAGYAATQTLEAASPSRIRWLRGGGSPEVLRARFELSTNGGTQWTDLGAASRITGGWEKTGLTLPVTGRLRARATVGNGMGNGSQGWMETAVVFTLAPEVAVHNGATDTSPEITDGQPQPVDFGITRQGTPVTRSLTITNAGNADLHLADLTAPAGFSLIGLPSFPATLAPGLSLTIQLKLDAAAIGTATGAVNLSSDDANEGAFDFPVTGTVVTPEIRVFDGSVLTAPEVSDGQAIPINFGTARQGTPIVRGLLIANTGTARLLLQGLTMPPGYTLLNPPAFPAAVEIGETLTLNIRLDAAALGTFAGTAVISSDDFDEATFDFPLTGIVVSPEIAVHDGALSGTELADGQTAVVDFGTARQATPVVRTITVANTGTAPLLINGVTVPAGYTALNLLQLPIAIGVNQALGVQFRLDAAALGTFSGSITIASDDLDEAVFDFPVTGTVVSPEIVLHNGGNVTAPELTDGQAEAVDFGRNIQGTPATRPFTVTNTGTAELLVSSVTVPPGYTALNVPPLPLTLNIDQTTTFQISLTTPTVGTHAGSVMIASDDLDEALFDFPITGEVFIPDPVSSVVSTTTTLNRQTGLREQTIHITNDTTATVPAYNLVIRGLPAGVEVNNASETRADGSVVVYIRQGMTPHSTQDIVLEYYSPNRAPAEISPQLSTEVILNPPDLSVPGGEAGLAIENITRLTGGEMLLEFTTTPGRRYEVQFSRNGQPWQASLPPIRAAANRTQWLDRGLPRTDRHPSLDASRFYRVRENP